MQKKEKSAKVIARELRKLLKKCGPQKYSVKLQFGWIVITRKGKVIYSDALDAIYNYKEVNGFGWFLSNVNAPSIIIHKKYGGNFK